MKALLALEDGSVFTGRAFAGQGEVVAQLVFNTGMMGYQETISDPSHTGRIMCFTYPLIGSYGVNREDGLSDKAQVAAVLVREYVARPRNFRAQGSLAEYLRAHGVLGVEGMDTRAITRRVSQQGPMGAVLSTVDTDAQSLVAKARKVVEGDLVARASCSRAHAWLAAPEDYSLPFVWAGSGRWRVAVLDLGVRTSLLNRLLDYNLKVMVLPANTTAQQIMELNPHGLIISSGPGAPAQVGYVRRALAELMGQLPMWGVGLGHLLLAEAAGAKLRKLVPGHFAGSQTVQELSSGQVGVSEQNLLWALDDAGLPADMAVTYRNQLDGSIAGFSHQRLPLTGVAFHPEVAGGPLGEDVLFADFTRMLG